MDRARWSTIGTACCALLALLLAAGMALAAPQTTGGECASCHDQAGKLEKSAHGSLTCDTCHEGHEKYPHPAGAAKPECKTCHESIVAEYNRGVHGQAARDHNSAAPECGVCHGGTHELLRAKSAAFREAVPDTCGMCHTEVVNQFRASVHGQALARGVTQAPLCTDCHGEHAIIRHTATASPVNPNNIRDTCGSCHGDVRLSRKFGIPNDRMVSFDASFHGLASKAGGAQTVANCASCHGIHNILQSKDPKSTIHPRNLAKTCGKCHPGAGTRFAISQVHVTENTEPMPIRVVRQFYLLIIPVTIGLMLLHNGGDWMRKLIRLRGRQAGRRHEHHFDAGHRELRMLPFERIQHAVMAFSFIILVWTGFALKYPDQWWAKPLMVTTSLRSLVHRTAAVIFILVSVTHAVSLIVNRNLRLHWLEMLPKARDLREALANFAYNLGLGDRPPGRSPHSYIEKAEYWAVIWGAFVMIASGVLLWANNLAMKLLPKLWLDVATSIHFYEAVLATLAIVVWHFYGIIFDPDVYPLDTAFLTGYSVRKEGGHGAGEPKESAAHGD